jgi:hypothetical protein
VGETISVFGSSFTQFAIPLDVRLFSPLAHAERYLAPASGQTLPADGA